MRVRIVLLLTLAAACEEPRPAETTYYQREIDPIFGLGCTMQTTGCHLPADGAAAGNLDLSSYDALMRRRDTLEPFGPYPFGLLLMKVVGPQSVAVETPSGVADVTTDVRHAAGGGIGLDSRAFTRLQEWIRSGYRRDGMPRERSGANEGDCSTGAGSWPGFDPSAPLDAGALASYEQFVADVQPVLRNRCAGSACHGAALADYRLACGDDESELRWNWFISLQHLAEPVDASEMLRRPLDPARGGAYHGGGTIFESNADPGYDAIEVWAEDTLAAAPELVREDRADTAYRFFAERVQPVLVRKGCLFMSCHSPLSFHGAKFRGGSQGAFSRVATRRNYEIAIRQLAVESPDPAASRIVAKNLFLPESVEGGQGIAHRGGPLLEDFGAAGRATAELCAGLDVETADLDEVPAYCVLARWHQHEREAAIARGEVVDDPGALRGLIWVARPAGVGSIADFDSYRPGADLRLAAASLDAAGAIAVGAPASVLAGCGLDPATADIRQPAVSWDGARVAFAARSAASEPLRLYQMDADGTGCAPIAGVAAPLADENGILTHDFDPAFAPDGRIVFASTRGNLDRSARPYAGPTRTPASMAPNANLYVFEPDRAPAVRQLTFLLNQELAPSFKSNGRVIFTTEKREPGFRQLALRRQNLDGGDYHPLFAQRSSVGFAAATEVAQLPTHDFAFVAGPLDATDGAGTIAIANRSIGPDQHDRDPGDRTYVHSLRQPFSGAAFRSPAALPGTRLLASCALGRTDLTGAPFDFDLCELDPATGAVRVVAGESGLAEVDAVAIFGRRSFGIHESHGDIAEANASTEVLPGETDAVARISDVPMIASLFFENTRVGRPIDGRIGGFDVVEVLPPPAGATSFADVAAQVIEDEHGQMFVSRVERGHVPLFADGSAAVRLAGGAPIVFRFTDGEGRPLDFPEGAVFTGEMIQREQFQYYPGERSRQSIPRRFFNTACGGCHGSISGRELDVGLDVDIITGASEHLARTADPVDLR